MRVALRTADGKFIGAVNGGGSSLMSNRDAAGAAETFTMTNRGDGMVSLQTTMGQYLHSADRRRVMADRREFGGSSETFRLIDRGKGAVALQASNGRYVSTRGPVRSAGLPPLRISGGYLGPPELNPYLPLEGAHDVTYADTIERWETFQLIVFPSPRWMEAVYYHIKDKTLAQLCLPGSHDSGTYQLFDILAPDANDIIRELWNKARVGGATGIGEFIKDMAVTQTKTFYQQFADGIRYIDLRICFMDGKFYTCHSLRGNLISKLMQDVRKFLDENKKEVLLFKVGFKSMTDKQKNDAWTEMKGIVGPDFYRPGSIGELLGKRVSELVDAKAPKRAIFLLDSADNIHGIYSSKITTNQGVIENLRNKTAAFPGGNLLEAQCIRPISDEDFIRGYVQKHGCRLLGAFALLINPVQMPIVSPIMMTIVGVAGAALPAYLFYVRNFDPRPTNLVQNARDSRSILREYIQWLAANPAIKPQLLTSDFIEELPLVDICIRISTGEPFQDLVRNIVDQRPFPPTGDRMVVFDCTAQAIASAFKAGAYAISEAGNWLLRQMGLGSGPLNSALRSAGYAGQEIVRFFNNLGGEFKKFFDNLGRWLNPRNWFRRAHDPNVPRTAADDFLDKLEEDAFREELLPAMADVAPGDWDAIVRIAGTAGFQFTAEEIQRAVPDGFFQGAGEYPELGWDRSTLTI